MIKNSDTSYKSKKDVKTKDGDTITMYEYSENHLKKRDEKKADKVNHLQTEMDNIVKDAKKKFNSKDSKEQMTALAVLLIDHTYERVGNERSADEGHHGVTTWEVDHLSFKDGKAVLKYVGKSGVDHTKEVTDKTLISALKDLKSKSKSGFLFQNDDASVRASDVNEYLKRFDITAKDIRGYHANRLVQEKLKKISPVKDEDKKKQERERKKQFKEVVEEAAVEVGHEPTTLRNQYLAPSLEEDFIDDGKVNKKVTAMSHDSIDILAIRLASEHVGKQFGIRTAGEIRHIKDNGPVKRRNVKTHPYQAKDFRSLTKVLWHISVGLGHVSSGMNQLARQKSIHISPDGRLGGRGYDKSIADIRKDLYSAVEVLSALQDTLYDEITGPHWQPKLKEMPKKEKDEVEEMIQEVNIIRDDPDAFGPENTDEEEAVDRLLEDEKEEIEENKEDEFAISVMDEE